MGGGAGPAPAGHLWWVGQRLLVRMERGLMARDSKPCQLRIVHLWQSLAGPWGSPLSEFLGGTGRAIKKRRQVSGCCIPHFAVLYQPRYTPSGNAPGPASPAFLCATSRE